MGFHNTIAPGNNAYADFKHGGLRVAGTEPNSFFACPSKVTKTNYVDVLVYALFIMCEIFPNSRKVPYKAAVKFKTFSWNNVASELWQSYNMSKPDVNRL